jgi:hypothetical protein
MDVMPLLVCRDKKRLWTGIFLNIAGRELE